jgi:hypothetical protein
MSEVELEQHHRRQFDALSFRLASEARDEAWAASMEAALQSDLASIGDGGPTLLRVLCGRTVCGVQARWQSYAAATERYEALLHHHYQTKCARSIFLPQPEHPELPYEATLYFDCASAPSRGP